MPSISKGAWVPVHRLYGADWGQVTLVKYKPNRSPAKNFEWKPCLITVCEGEAPWLSKAAESSQKSSSQSV